MNVKLLFALLLVASTGLFACGGGGGSNKASTDWIYVYYPANSVNNDLDSALTVGKTDEVNLNASVLNKNDEDVTDGRTFTWNSSNTNVVEFVGTGSVNKSSMWMVAADVGTARITISCGKLIKICDVTVTE